MSTVHPRTIHLPLKQCKLSIVDITHMEIVPISDSAFREQLETLVSYNICNDGTRQDCLYIEQGHLLNLSLFQSHSMAIDPK